MSFTEKRYQELLIEIVSMQEDVVTASTGGDSFNDDYRDPNLNFTS